MNKIGTISVAMATYNGEYYLKEQLDSLNRQTLLPYELIISDDNSTDRTIEIIKKFTEKAKFRVVLSFNQNDKGYSNNFNNALNQTTGDFVFLCDQDDVWFENKIETLINLTFKYPNKMVFMNDALFTNSSLLPYKYTKYQQIVNLKLDDTAYVMGTCCLFKREFLDYVLPIPANYKSHDNWLVNIADCLKLKHIEPVVLQFYRRHGSNESNRPINWTKKLPFYFRYFYELNEAIKRDNKLKLTEEIEQFEILTKGLNRVLKNIPKDRQDDLIKLIKRTKERLEILIKRNQLMGSSLIKRVFKSYSLYKNYNISIGVKIKFFIEDLFVKSLL